VCARVIEPSTHRLEATQPLKHVRLTDEISGVLSQKLVRTLDWFTDRTRSVVESSHEGAEAGHRRPGGSPVVIRGSFGSLFERSEFEPETAASETEVQPRAAQRPIVAQPLEFRDRRRGELHELSDSVRVSRSAMMAAVMR
jgi:hypothetical protein